MNGGKKVKREIVSTNHVSVTSHTTVGGKHNIITRRSAMAKFTMNMLVTVRIVAFAYTAMHTNILPI